MGLGHTWTVSKRYFLKNYIMYTIWKICLVKIQLLKEPWLFSNFPVGFWIPIIFSTLNLNCSNVLDLRNKLKKSSVSKIVLTFHCFLQFQNFCKFLDSASDFKRFSRSLEQFFLTLLGQNNFGSKIPLFLQSILQIN